MRKLFITLGILGFLITTSPYAVAGNSGVEVTLQGYGDTSMFYQALVTTGVINNLSEGTAYTIFAPTNAAFAEIRPQTYPCFYAAQCRQQIAALLLNHIIVGRHDLADLATYGNGIKSVGMNRLRIEEPFVGKYTVDGQDVLSKAEVGGSIIYRINGVITSPQELAQFQTVSLVPAAIPQADDGTVTTEKTITQTTYQAPSINAPTPYMGGSMAPATGNPGSNTTQSTTVTHTYTTEQ